MASKDELSPSGLERATYLQPGWNHVLNRDFELLNAALLKVSGLCDVNLDGLRDGDVLVFHAASNTWRARRKK